MSEELATLSFEHRLAFIGLWCYSDREGRFKWRPKTFKAQLFPYDELDFEKIMDNLEQNGFIKSYLGEDGNTYGSVVNFNKHQNIHKNEKPSEIPPPTDQPIKSGKIGKVPNSSEDVSEFPPTSTNTNTSTLTTTDTSIVSVPDDEIKKPYEVCERIKDEINRLHGRPIILDFKASLRPIKQLLEQGVSFEDITKAYRAVFDSSLDGDTNATWHRGKLSNATFGNHLLKNWGDLQNFLLPTGSTKANKIAAVNRQMEAKYGNKG